MQSPMLTGQLPMLTRQLQRPPLPRELKTSRRRRRHNPLMQLPREPSSRPQSNRRCLQSLLWLRLLPGHAVP